jgi:hypothetical protein
MFVGVFARDRLPTKLKSDRPSLLVCNTDPHDRPGEHWIVLYVEDSSYGEYFDSFGRPPDQPFRTFMDRYCSNWTRNERQLQSIISYYCGHYCVFYCLHRSRNKNINAITGMLSADTALNDYLVHNYVCKTFY